MMQHQRHLHRNPWYRGYMPRSYIAPHKLASYGCSMCLIVFGIFFLFGGTIITAISKHANNSFQQHENDPRFQSDFFKKAREDHRKKGFDHTNATNAMQTIGIVILCLGGVFILSSIGLCCFAKLHMDKRRNNEQSKAARPLNQAGTYPPPPPGSYPQQQPHPSGYPQYAPEPGTYPPQPGTYPPQPDTYPSQPVMIYPQQTAPPSNYPYPPPTQQPPPSELYVSEKNVPHPVSQGSSTVNVTPIGFK